MTKLPDRAGDDPREPIPYGRQRIEEDDIASVTDVLQSPWLTTGPKVRDFERAFAEFTGTAFAVGVSNGTAALHTALFGMNLEAGDEVILSPMTFAATANAVVYHGGEPVFADVEPGSLLLDPAAVEEKISPKTRAIIAVDYAGQPCRYDELTLLAARHGLVLLDDACHAVGGSYRGKPVGSLAALNTFSFHPVKNMTTGEGGMITTDDESFAERMIRFRNHGITGDFRSRASEGSWFYEQVDLGFNYRITDIQCALGLTQLRKLPRWIARRREIARRYDCAFDRVSRIAPLTVREEVSHAYHLYVVRLSETLAKKRPEIFSALRDEGIGVNVHYIPVHFHPYYRERFGTGPGLCPVAEEGYERILSLPIFPDLTDEDVRRVVDTVLDVTGRFAGNR